MEVSLVLLLPLSLKEWGGACTGGAGRSECLYPSKLS